MDTQKVSPDSLETNEGLGQRKRERHRNVRVDDR